MADKIVSSDNLKAIAAKPADGPSPAQLEALKSVDTKPLDSAKDVGLPGLEIHDGVKKVSNLDSSQVVFSQDAGGSAQLHSVRTFDGHIASPAYAEDGSVNKLTIQPRGEESYSLTKSSDAEFSWVDSRTGDSSRMLIEAHAGENPGKTGEIAMYEEATGKATLFAPEGATKPETALKDFRFLFGRDEGYPYGSGSALPFKSDSGASVSIFDPAYRGIPTVTAIPQHRDLSAKAEIMHIKTDDGRGVGLKFDAAASGADGRPLVTFAAISDADGHSFELKRIGDTNQWRDSSTGALRNLEIERAIGKSAATSAEILIKDLDDASKNLFFSPHSESPLLTDKIHVPAAAPIANVNKGADSLDLSKIYKSAEKLDFAKSYKDALLTFSTELSRGVSYSEVEYAGVGLLKSTGGKIALGAAAAGALYAAGDWIYSKYKGEERPEKVLYKTPASEEFKTLEK